MSTSSRPKTVSRTALVNGAVGSEWCVGTFRNTNLIIYQINYKLWYWFYIHSKFSNLKLMCYPIVLWIQWMECQHPYLVFQTAMCGELYHLTDGSLGLVQHALNQFMSKYRAGQVETINRSMWCEKELISKMSKAVEMTALEREVISMRGESGLLEIATILLLTRQIIMVDLFTALIPSYLISTEMFVNEYQITQQCVF